MNVASESLERFGCHVPFEVRFSDLDLNEHVNNGALVQHLAMAPEAWQRTTTAWEPMPPEGA